jgi:pSer/pThr/pTyr-binding forkhead associated (FHA) protein
MESLVLRWVANSSGLELMPGLNRFGRNPTNDFRIPDASISSFHCEVTRNLDHSVSVRDLASTNGTYIDGVRVQQGEVRPGQTLRLGTVEFQLERASVAQPVRIPEPVLAGDGDDSANSWKGDNAPKSFLGKLSQTLKIPWTR